MPAAQKVIAPVVDHQNAGARVVFSDEQILNGKHGNFLETFQLIFEADQTTHHLVLIHKIEDENQYFLFPETTFDLYERLLRHYQIEKCSEFPARPFYPVFGTNEDFNYWRDLLNWDQPV